MRRASKKTENNKLRFAERKRDTDRGRTEQRGATIRGKYDIVTVSELRLNPGLKE